jgi:hypothetical protein
MRFLHSGKCLNKPYLSTADGVRVEQYDCVGWAGDTERWQLEPAYTTPSGRQYYLIRNRQSGKCLNVNLASFDDGAAVMQYTCGVQWTNEWFTMVPSERPDFYKVMNYRSSKCLNVEGASTLNQALIIQYACDGYIFQGADNMRVQFQQFL